MSIPDTSDQSALVEQFQLEPMRQTMAPYQGGRIRVWFYTVSLRQLHIRMSHEDICGTDCVFVVCSACTRISGPFDWAGSSLHVHYQPSVSRFVITDPHVAFELICGRVAAVRGDAPNFHEGQLW
jgi:hypothetical protein